MPGSSDLSEPENRYERHRGKLLEVYLPVRTPGGRPLLFESYQPFAPVSASGRDIWREFAPTLLVALVLLWLLQLPLAWSFVRRLRQGSWSGRRCSSGRSTRRTRSDAASPPTCTTGSCRTSRATR